MGIPDELLASVEAAFGQAARHLEPWPDPHPDRAPLDEEYSRVTDPDRWRIVGARADAWLLALAGAGLAVVEHDAPVRWAAAPGTTVTRAARAVPARPGALPLVVARSVLGGVDDAGVTLGVGDPAVVLDVVPFCGCDACDDGSRGPLDQLDRAISGVVSGGFRRLTRGDREITVVGPAGWSASGSFRRGEVERLLADPRGWEELSGPSWLPDR